jgi:hypothetical protein
LVKTWLPEEDEEIEDLEPYLVGRIPAKYVAPFTNEVQKLASESRIQMPSRVASIVKPYYFPSTSWLEKERITLASAVTSRVGAQNLFPRLVAVTKACCPACASLVNVAAIELVIEISCTRSHGDFTPVPYHPSYLDDLWSKLPNDWRVNCVKR